MRSRASINGHPIHPMLVTIPIGLWVFSFIADLFYVGTGNTVWSTVAYYTMGGGILGALAAAIPGMVDLLLITSGRTRTIGLTHMVINLLVVFLFLINFWIRTSAEVPSSGAIWMSGISVALLAISGWLGGEMVFRHAVGVEDRKV